MSGENIFATKEMFMAAITPFLRQEMENESAGLTRRAREIFYEPSVRLIESRKYFDLTRNPKVGKKLARIQRNLNELSRQYPTESQAWDHHHRTMGMINQALTKGIINAEELPDLQDFVK